VAGDAVHFEHLVLAQLSRIERRFRGRILGRRPVHIRDAHPGNVLFQAVGGDVFHLVLDVPVNAVAQPLALGAPARVHQQVDSIRIVVLVVAIPVQDAQAVVGELLRVVAQLARVARGAHTAHLDWVLVILGERRPQQPGVSRLASELLVERAAPDVAVYA